MAYVNSDFQGKSFSQPNLDRIKMLFEHKSPSELVQDGFGDNWRAELIVVCSKTDGYAKLGGLEIDDEFVLLTDSKNFTHIGVFPNDIYAVGY